MRVIGDRLYKTSTLLVLSFLFSLCLVVVSQTSSYANTDTPISSRFPAPDSANLTSSPSSPITPVTGVGRGSFNGNYTWAKVYVPIGKTTQVRVQQRCDLNFGSGTVRFRIRSLSNVESDTQGYFSQPGFPDQDWIGPTESRSNGECSDVVFSINKNRGTPSNLRGHEKYRAFAIIANISPTSGSGAERYFYFTSNGAAGDRIGAARTADLNSSLAGNEYFSIYHGSGTWDYSIMFAPRCDDPASTLSNPIKIYDADNDVYQFGNKYMYAELLRSGRDRSSPSWSTAKTWTRNELQGGVSQLGKSGTTGTLNYTFSKDYIYKFKIIGSSHPNTIQIRLPFDQIDGNTGLLDDEGCTPKWRLSPSTSKEAYPTAYTTPNPSPANNSQRLANSNAARSSFSIARFGHHLQEKKAKTDAPSGDHRWKVQYRTKRGSGVNYYGWYDKATSGSTNMTDTVTKGNSKTLTTGSRMPGVTTRFNDLADMKNKLAYSSSNSNHARLAGIRALFLNNSGGYRQPELGDEYCERLVYQDPSSERGIIDTPGTEECVQLTPTPPAPPCNPWTLNYMDGTIRQKYGSVWGGDEGRIVEGDDVWVSDVYGFFALANNAGPTSPASVQFTVGNSLASPWWVQTRNIYGHFNEQLGSDHTVARAEGGVTIPVQFRFNPTWRAADCTTGPPYDVGLELRVPYYYNIKPSSGISTSVNVEQGDEVSGSGSITIDSSGADIGANPSIPSISGDANASRSTTRSRPTDSQLIARRYTPAGNLIEQRNTGLQQSELNYDLNRTVNANNLSAVTFTPEQTATYEIGTKICYSMAVNNPTHRDTGWSESQPNCIKIIKSPKVRFENSDVLTGRQIPDSDDGSCDPLNTNAQIRAVGTTAYTINNYGFAPVNQTGSWGEYGVFATGQISGLGSAAFAYGQGSSNEVRKLQFGNQTPTSGGFRSYGSDCTFNWFSKLTKDAVNVADDDITVESQAGKTSQYSKNRSWNISANSLLNDTTSPTILYAKATGQNSCSTKDGSGRIEVTSDITYKASYPNVKDVPRVILMADCGIIIHKNVRNLDVGLITRGIINTCDMKDSNGAPISLYTDKNYGLTKDDCRQDLKVTGPVVTKKINLLRTAGSDTTQLPQFLIIPAENFAQNPSYLISTYEQARQKINLTVEYQDELPPRY